MFSGPSFCIYDGVENAMNLIGIEGYGSIASLEDSLYPYRYGHPKIPPANEDHADLMRRVATCVWIGKDEVDPYSLAAGYTRAYRGGHFTLEMHERARDAIARTDANEQIKKTARGGGPHTLLGVTALLSVTTTCLVWLAIPVIGLLQ